MLIQVVTTWEGSPAGLEKIVEGSKQAGPIHESMAQETPDFGELALAET